MGHYANRCPEKERDENNERNNSRRHNTNGNERKNRNNKSLNFCRATFEEEEALDSEDSSSDSEYSEDEKQVFLNTRSGKRYRNDDFMESDEEDENQTRRENINKNQDIQNKRKEALQKARAKNRQKNICNRCGIQGHFATECERVQCPRCGQMGHEWNRCPKYPHEKKERKKIEESTQLKEQLDFIKYIIKNVTKTVQKRKMYELIKGYEKRVNYVEKMGKTDYTPTKCDVNIQGYETEAIVDSGSSVTVMTKGLMDELSYEITSPSKTNLNPFGNGKYPSLGIIKDMQFFVGKREFSTNVEIVDLPEKMLLFGTDWLKGEEVKIDYNKDCLEVGKNNSVPIYFGEEVRIDDEEYEDDEQDFC
jgi:hypothetical protein